MAETFVPADKVDLSAGIVFTEYNYQHPVRKECNLCTGYIFPGELCRRVALKVLGTLVWINLHERCIYQKGE